MEQNQVDRGRLWAAGFCVKPFSFLPIYLYASLFAANEALALFGFEPSRVDISRCLLPSLFGYAILLAPLVLWGYLSFPCRRAPSPAGAPVETKMTGRSQSPSVSQNQDDSASQESGAWRRKRRLGWFLILLLFALHGRALILERVVVDGPSMKPGLQPGDGFWIQKRGRLELTFPFFRSEVWNAGLGNLKRGSVIVFHYPDASCRRQIWIKRVVALPGDKYEFRNGQLIINGENEDFALYGMDPVDTDLLPEGYQPPVADPPPEVRKLGVEAIYAALNGLQREGKVPPGSVLALGDNRSQSRDSRIIGFVPMELVLGIKL